MKNTLESSFTPEQEVLLWAIRVDHIKDQRIADILEKGVDWAYILYTAKQHGIIPLLYRRLIEDMGTLVPSDEVRSLRRLFMENAANNLRMTQVLIKVLDLLADADVEAMPFKGPVLAVQAYEDISMRSFYDLDLLIHEKDFDRMYKTLLKAEFIPQNIVDTKAKKKIIIFEKDLGFYSHDISLEIHWQIIEPLLSVPLNQDQLWIRAGLIPLNGSNVKTLSLEDTILVICLHGTKHYWQELKWLADLTNLIINHTDLNWQELIKRAELVGVRRIVGISLYLAKTQCGVKYPPDIENIFVSDTRISHLSYEIESKFFRPLNTSLFSVPPIFFLKSREGMREQMNYSLKLFFNRLFIPDSFDFKFFLLPEYLYPLYFFIRPFRLITGYIQSFGLP